MNQTFDNLRRLIESAENTAKPDETVSVVVPVGNVLMDVRDIMFCNDLIVFEGYNLNANGTRSTAIQHSSQVNVLIMRREKPTKAVGEIEESAEPERRTIGFKSI